MALQKQPVAINFVNGLDTKSDAKQVQIGKFLTLVNSVFNNQGRLTKRNGYNKFQASITDSDQLCLTTLNGNLIATGQSLYAYSADSQTWLNQGNIRQVDLSTQSLIRVSTSQTSPDMAVAANGLACLVYTDSGNNYYQISDTNTGQQIVSRQALPASATNPRAFLLGQYFIITFMVTVSASTHFRYIAIPTSMPSSPLAATDIDSISAGLTTGYGGAVAGGNLYLAWSGSSTTIRLRSLSSTLIVSALTTMSGSHTATYMSVAADLTTSTPNIWVSFWDSSSTNGFTAVYDHTLAEVLAPTQIITTTTILGITSSAKNSVGTVFYENSNTYGSGGISSVKTSFVSTLTVTQAGVVSAAAVLLRSVGLASKSFIANDNNIYLMVTYGESNSNTSPSGPDQNTYFLVDVTGRIYLRLAYGNGGGYNSTQVLPNVVPVGSSYYFPYRVNDFLASVNKNTNVASGTITGGIYTQTGISLAKISLTSNQTYSSEIAGALHLTGGQLWEYDGVRPVEHGFHVWPDNIAVSTSTSGGLITAGTYFYAFAYEWTDNAGNLHRSAPSVPVKQVTSTSTSTNTILVPTLRLTDKVSPNPVRIVGYRWSVAQQTYYQFTSLTNPTVNDPTVDFVTITDTLADSSILGNVLLYTTGGVVENIAAPASIASCLFKNRLFLINAENPNELWYSKQVLNSTPVEMSDQFTLFIAPTTGAQGSTGPMTAISAMDDKLIIFKKDAIYYVTGTGPDITGAQNDFSDPVFVTSSVGCANPRSIVMMPNGLMFQSDKGIWLLARDLSTNYIGAPVEAYTSNQVLSAQSIPGTNQVRFLMDDRITLMFDYYYGQWGTFTNVLAVNSTLYNGYETYVNTLGQVFQETPNSYLDGGSPVLMSFTTAWISLGGLQGYERFYELLLLGTYYSPFKLAMGIAYDYNPSPEQSTIVTPDNYVAPWGGEANWGGGPSWGGNGNVFQSRVFPQKQKCSTFQISMQEVFDQSLGAAPGQGLDLSGMLLMVGVKRANRTSKASQSFG